ncbi:GNAT family protein [Arthrobacter sp. H35-D1]|uniref:GNAT family N-acetyltransferase n=1 Tax=Arthrobacter sp. H35-D1 TaxID=3046202 RepID=UPI0024B95B44|nr:GNAT family protein [Arthrobacter sp. H35-D1]MDJ0313706.1 GNAT family protein [Arthrobacter sp. H35-D1]
MSTLELSTAWPVLSDGLTSLRRFGPGDAPALAAMHRDTENVRWTASEAAMDDARAAELIEGSIAQGWETGSYLRFAVAENRGGGQEIVGTLSLHEVFATSGGGSASVGIKMLPSGRGTGSAQRAVELLTGYAFGNLGLEFLHWRTTAGNARSTALAERCGFILVAEIPGYGHLDGQVADGLVFSQTSAQYRDHVQGTAQQPALDPRPTVPELRSETVVLRALTMADAPQLVENCKNPEAVQWTTVPLNYTAEHAEFFINSITAQGWSTGETLTFAVADAGTDRLLGTVDLQCKNPGSAAIGINFGSQARGTGAALAAVRLLLDYAFNQLNLSYLHWSALVPNWGSRKLAWKLGFSFDGQIRGDYNDRGTPADRWVLSLAATDPQAPQQPWTGPVPPSR